MLSKDMLLLDIVEKYPVTEQVFHHYEEKTGVCWLCEHLFDSIEQVSQSYNVNIEEVLQELNLVIQ